MKFKFLNKKNPTFVWILHEILQNVNTNLTLEAHSRKSKLRQAASCRPLLIVHLFQPSIEVRLCGITAQAIRMSPKQVFNRAFFGICSFEALDRAVKKSVHVINVGKVGCKTKRRQIEYSHSQRVHAPIESNQTTIIYQKEHAILGSFTIALWKPPRDSGRNLAPLSGLQKLINLRLRYVINSHIPNCR